MFAGEMKIITLANISAAKNQQHHNSDKRMSPSNGIMSNSNINSPQQSHNAINTIKINDKSVGNKSAISNNLKLPNMAKYGLISHKNSKKQHQNMYYNIPTTTGTANRKKYYQQQQQMHHSRHLHNFNNNIRDKKNNNTIAVKNRNMIEVIGYNAEDSVYNTSNNTAPYINTNKHYIDENSSTKLASIISNNLSLSTNEVHVEYSKSSPSNSSKFQLSTSSVHISTITCTCGNISNEDSKVTNSGINFDCKSCWAKLVTPQTTSPSSSNLNSSHTSLASSSESFLLSSSSSSISALVSASTLSSSSTTESNGDSLRESDSKLKSNSYINNLTKKKSFWKSNNANSKSCNLVSKKYTFPNQQGKTLQVPAISSCQNKYSYSTVDCTERTEATVAGAFSGKSNSNTFADNTTAMTTALATNTVSTTNIATVNSTATATSTATSTSTSTSTAAASESPANVVILPASSSLLAIEKANTTAATVSTSSKTLSSVSTIPITSSPTPLSTTLTTSSNTSTTATSGPTSPNSYTLDFLHSVGVQMTGGANLASLKTSLGSMRPSTSFGNHNTGISPARNTYSYPNVTTQRPHATQRHISGGGSSSSGIGGSSGPSVGPREQHGHRYQQHHHQPQQLTIASFMQKELLAENFVGGGNSRVNTNTNGGASLSSGSIGSITNTNDYGNQQSYHNHQRYHCYYQPHYQQSQQQQYTALQHTYHSNIGNDSISRSIGNGGNIASNQHPQPTRQHVYQNFHSNTVNTGGTSSSTNQQYNRNLSHGSNHQQESGNILGSNNLQSSKQLQQQLPGTKKPNYSSSASSCSSSSSSSSSVSSTSSQTSTTSYRQQKGKSNTQMNLVIEPLPKKVNMSAHRTTHRLQQAQFHNHQPNHNQQFPVTTVPSASTGQQSHQNILNLTYINTDVPSGLPSVSISTSAPSRSCSPASHPMPPSGTASPQLQESSSSLLLCYNTHNHYQQQQNYLSSKRMLTPLALSIPSAHVVSAPATSPLALSNVVCYTQLSESTTSSDSSHATTPTASVVSAADYDDSDSSSTHSTAIPHRRQKYNQLKSMSLSSSSSASSTSSSVTHNYNAPQQAVTVVAVPQLHNSSPIDFAYSTSFPPSVQHYQPQINTQQHQHIASSQQHQQQPQAHYRNNSVISLLSVPMNNNYTDDELNSIKQQQQSQPPAHHQHTPQHFYFASGEHLNAATLPTGVGNGGYWSPLQHSNFLYSQAAANMLAASSCSSTPASLSPRVNEVTREDNQQQIQLHHQSPGDQLPPIGHIKRSSTSQISNTTISQPSHQMQRPGTQSTASATASLGSVNAMRSRISRNQQQGQSHHQSMSTAPPSLTVPHIYPQHNLLYSGAQPHLRSSTTSSHEFFAHTPPDRFLARAHLIEAKEAPAALLNNSKWDILSQGVWNKFISSQQTEETFKQKMRLWRYLYIIIKNTYPRFGLYLVGSTISGFGADTSDVDMCLVSRSTSSVEPRMEALFNLTVLRDYLSKSAEFENFNLIEAKVPILRFRDRIHQLEVDLNFNNCVGIKNTHLLYCYSQLDWRLRPLVLVTKLWAQYHNINNAKNMTISSYSLVLMVIHFLQCAVNPAVLPCLHDMFPEKFPLLRSNDFGYVDMNETIGPYESKNSQTLGELFLYFLEYYSCFDYTQFAISIRTGGLLPINVCRQAKSLKNDIHQWKELCIEEPFDLTNTARSVYDFETFERVKAVFVASWRMLQQTLDLNSIFTPIIIPPSSSVNPSLSNPTQYEDTESVPPSVSSTKERNDIGINATSVTTLLTTESNTENSLANSITLTGSTKSSSKKSHDEKELLYSTPNGSDKNNNTLTALLS